MLTRAVTFMTFAVVAIQFQVGCKGADAESQVQAVNLPAAGQTLRGEEIRGQFSFQVSGATAVYDFSISSVTATSAVFSSTLKSVSDQSLQGYLSNDAGIQLTSSSSDGVYASADGKVRARIDQKAKTARVESYFGYATQAAAGANTSSGSQNTQAGSDTVNTATGSGSGRVDANGHVLPDNNKPITPEQIAAENQMIAEHPDCADYDCEFRDANGDLHMFSKINHSHKK